MTIAHEYNLPMPEISVLARDVLNTAELKQAEILGQKLLGTEEERDSAVQVLQKLVGYTPKRPLFYAWGAIGNLPKQTRPVVEDLGHHVDHLVKYYAAELLTRKKNTHQSLGTNLRDVKGKMDEQLWSALDRYNRLIYVPAKHEFNIPEGKAHLFSCIDAALVCFISMKLAATLMQISGEARTFAQNGFDHEYDDDDFDCPTWIKPFIEIRRLFKYDPRLDPNNTQGND